MIVPALVVIGLAAGSFELTKPAVAGDQLTITASGGPYQMSLRKAIFVPFSKATAIKITEDEYNGEASKIRAMVETGTVSWDVVDVTTNVVMQLCAEGVLETIEWNKVGLDRAKFIGGNVSDCGVPNVTYSFVIGYDKDKLPNGPKTITDFFDTQKFPGKRGMQKSPRFNLLWALIADGVPVKDVNEVLNTAGGVDRAFQKLDTIKKDIVWYQTNTQPAQLLADGQVVMTTAPNGRIYDAVKNAGKHFEIMWDVQQWDVGYWAIPKRSPRRDAAYKFLAFAGSPQAQARLTGYIPYGPANQDAIALVDPAMLPHLATAPDHMRNAVQTDAAFWADKFDELNQRFSVWLAR